MHGKTQQNTTHMFIHTSLVGFVILCTIGYFDTEEKKKYFEYLERVDNFYASLFMNMNDIRKQTYPKCFCPAVFDISTSRQLSLLYCVLQRVSLNGFKLTAS